MATSRSFRNIELTAGGGTIELDVSKPYDVYYFFTQGSVTLSSNWTITHTGTPYEGMEIEVRWRADVDLNNNDISFFGSNMDGDITDKEFTAVLAYNGSSWDVMKSVDYEEDQTINSDHIKDGSLQGSDMDFDNLLGDGLTDDSSLIIVQRDTTNGTSILTSVDGTRLDGDENTPDNGTYYGKTGGNKGWFTLGVGMSRYDSGWKRFPDASIAGSEGLLRASNHSEPLFRVIGRTVYLRGRILIPLDDGGGSFVSDADNYSSTVQTAVHTSTSGISINDNNSIGIDLEFPPLLNDGDLFPDQQVFTQDPIVMGRFIQEQNSTVTIRMTAVVTKLQISTSGVLRVSSVSQFEMPNSDIGDATTHAKLSLLRYLNTVADSGDYALDWSSYRSSHDGASFQNNWTQSSYQYPFNINTNDVSDWGGFVLPIDGITWNISSSTSLEDIQALFSNYSDA